MNACPTRRSASFSNDIAAGFAPVPLPPVPVCRRQFMCSPFAQMHLSFLFTVQLSPRRPSHRLMYSPSTPLPPHSQSFMMETDTNAVIGFRDKLFTLPMLSAASSAADAAAAAAASQRTSIRQMAPFFRSPASLLIDPPAKTIHVQQKESARRVFFFFFLHT